MLNNKIQKITTKNQKVNNKVKRLLFSNTIFIIASTVLFPIEVLIGAATSMIFATRLEVVYFSGISIFLYSTALIKMIFKYSHISSIISGIVYYALIRLVSYIEVFGKKRYVEFR